MISQILIGGAVGLISAVVGAILQYRISGRKHGGEQHVLPGCMVLMAGGLGAAGVIAAAGSLVLSASMMPAITAGAGVATGFTLGFVGIVFIWLVLFRMDA